MDEEHDHQERVMNIKRKFCQVAHSLHISSFMEKAQLAFHKQVILIGAASGGLIILKGVLIIHSCFCFTLRTMFNSTLVGGMGVVDGVNSSFGFKFFSKIQLLYLLTCFSYLFFNCLVVICMCFSFFLLLFCISYELGWSLVMVLRMLWYCAQIVFLSQNLGYPCIFLI